MKKYILFSLLISICLLSFGCMTRVQNFGHFDTGNMGGFARLKPVTQLPMKGFLKGVECVWVLKVDGVQVEESALNGYGGLTLQIAEGEHDIELKATIMNPLTNQHSSLGVVSFYAEAGKEYKPWGIFREDMYDIRVFIIESETEKIVSDVLMLDKSGKYLRAPAGLGY